MTSCEGINLRLQSYVGTQEVGEIDWTTWQWAASSGMSGDPTWTHGLIAQVTNDWGTWSGGLTAEMQSTCDAYTTACATVSSAVSDTQPVLLQSGVTFSNSWIERDNGAAASTNGVADTFAKTIGLSYTLQPNSTAGYGGATYVDSSWAAVPLTLRCDSIVANPDTATGNLDGCVNPAFTPTFTVDRTTGGASADMIGWAQAHLSAHWGDSALGGQPLHRLTGKSQIDANRLVVCPSSSSLQRDPDVYDASCDEFPFAATYESAGMPRSGVTDGSQCAQLTAVQTGNPTNMAASWTVNDVATPGSYNASDKCVRSMLPNQLNSTVGGNLGTFYNDNRLLDADPFWVSVTPPTGAVALPVPTNFNAGPLNPNEVWLNWTDNSTGTAHEISLQGGGIQTAPTGVPNYVWTGLTPGTQYCFRIRATTGTAWSAWTPSRAPNYYSTCVTTPVAGTVPPTAPTGVTATASNSFTIHVAWTDNSGGTAQYEVSDGSHSMVAPTGSTSLDWGTPSAGTTSCFQIRAVTASGSSAWVPGSSGACATTPQRACQSSLNTPDSSGYLDFYHGTGLAFAQDIQANGIDLSKSDPDTDFGKGFYVTTSLTQAEQWARKNFSNVTPSVVHYRIPYSALTPGSLCGLVFSTTSPSADYFSLIKGIGLNPPPIGGAGYDFVEGPLMLNRSAYLGGSAPVTGGQQDSFHTAAGAVILDQGFDGILSVPTSRYSLTLRSAANANYVSAELSYTGTNYAMLRARAVIPGPWETWTAYGLSNGDIALQSSANGDYVSAEIGYPVTDSNYAMLRARTTTIGPWETYQIVQNPDGTFSLQSTANGDYVSAELGYPVTDSNYAMLRARATTIGPWEEFTDDAESYSACTTCE